MNSDPTPDILVADHLYKTYKIGPQLLPVLKDVSFSISHGETMAIMGASGAGKSTLLHLLGGLDTPDEGEIRFEGKRLTGKDGLDLVDYRNQKVGYIFQGYHLLPELTALENVLVPGWLKRDLKGSMNRAMELLEIVGLKDRAEHRPLEMSGGEQQRVAIARALLNRPKIILADEPTGNLDSRTGDLIIDLLLKLQEKESTSLVLVTHDKKIASRCAKIMKMEDGRILAHALIDDL